MQGPAAVGDDAVEIGLEFAGEGLERTVGVEQFSQRDAVGLTMKVALVSQREPASRFDHVTGLLVVTQAIGLVDPHAVDHLPPVLGDPMEQVVYNLRRRALEVNTKIQQNRRCRDPSPLIRDEPKISSSAGLNTP